MIYLLFLLLLSIIYQDVKERRVYLWVLIASILINGIVYYQETAKQLFVLHVTLNIILVSLLSLILWVYTKFKMKVKLSEALGIGDVIFFLVFAVGFPLKTFLWLFVSSLVFSLILHILTKSIRKDETIPLAGFQALFLFVILFINLAFDIVNLYTI